MRMFSKLAAGAGALAAMLGVNAVLAQEPAPDSLEPGMTQGEGMMPMMGMMQQMSTDDGSLRRNDAGPDAPAGTGHAPAPPQDQQ